MSEVPLYTLNLKPPAGVGEVADAESGPGGGAVRQRRRRLLWRSRRPGGS